MSRYAYTEQPGQVVILPVKPGRRLHFGALAALEGGKMMVCIGYSFDGKQAVYVPMTQLRSLKAVYKRADRKIMYKLLKSLISRYEISL